MIDPITNLAFSMQSSPGVYALLLGSGISRSASIPTGWNITLDLVKKLAAALGEECMPSPEEWYRTKFGKAPDYSELLNSIGKGQAERQMLLQGYFERAADEPDEGVKQPTAAHRWIADLVAQGHVRVIITTNFDHLMETALREAGVEPSVISTPDHIKGALPLIHTRCCLLKVNGDYMDTRIRNTEEELAAYEPEFDSLLDRIFDEFGLVVCGWSAQWDGALRNALERTPSRRFSSYWIARGEIGSTAQGLISRRGMQIVKDRDADSFFSALQEQVKSLTEYARPHPLSTEAAVISLKRYLSEQKYRIQLADLISDEVERVLEMTSGSGFAFAGTPCPTEESVTTRICAYENAAKTLTEMAAVGGYWVENQQYQLWQETVIRLSTRRDEGGSLLWIHLQKYPAMLIFYALGLSSVEANRLDFLAELFATPIRHYDVAEEVPAVTFLPAYRLFYGHGEPKNLLTGMRNIKNPVNQWLYRTLRNPIKRIIPDDKRYSFVFDKFELILALAFAHRASFDGHYWAPHSNYCFHSENLGRILTDLQGSLSRSQTNSAYVTSRLFGNTVKECLESIEKFKESLETF